MRVLLLQLDGKLPNLALMKLAKHYRRLGAEVELRKRIDRRFDDQFDHVYASAIFSKSVNRVEDLKTHFPEAVLGGTWNLADTRTVEDIIGYSDEPEGSLLDYADYDKFDASIGFTQRGCRLKCGFCVVPKKEGRPRSVNTIDTIWRGPGYPKHLHLLDNDFFGQAREQWEARLDEIRTGGFKVCLNQGINTRMIDDESAAALASVQYYDDSFSKRRLYTAWDNIGDEQRFFTGVDCLARHGVPPKNLLVYMLIGYDKRETWERVLYRFNRMVAKPYEIKPYPMVFGNRDRRLPTENKRLEKRTLGEFQRWAVGRFYMVTSFDDYGHIRPKVKEQIEMFGPQGADSEP